MRATKTPTVKSNHKGLSPEQQEELIRVWKTRLEKNVSRHQGLEWNQVQAKLTANPATLWALHEMERTGGEPDVIGRDQQTGQYMFCDCSAESPTGRRSLCYDREALASRKEHKPADSAVGM